MRNVLCQHENILILNKYHSLVLQGRWKLWLNPSTWYGKCRCNTQSPTVTTPPSEHACVFQAIEHNYFGICILQHSYLHDEQLVFVIILLFTKLSQTCPFVTPRSKYKARVYSFLVVSMLCFIYRRYFSLIFSKQMTEQMRSGIK